MSFWILFMAALLAAGGLFSLLGNKEQKKLSARTNLLMEEIDNKYEDFIEKRLNMALLKQEKEVFDIEKLHKNAFIILKPEIDGLMAFINAYTRLYDSSMYHSKYFKSIIPIIVSILKKMEQKGYSSLSAQDEKKIYTAFQDAIRADLTQRVLDLNAGNYLTSFED